MIHEKKNGNVKLYICLAAALCAYLPTGVNMYAARAEKLQHQMFISRLEFWCPAGSWILQASQSRVPASSRKGRPTV